MGIPIFPTYPKLNFYILSCHMMSSNLAAGGLPAVVLGPGDIAQAHRADEFLELDQFEQGIKVYQELMSQPASFWDH